jgi:D-sedoheptulose 7-phosphate isomerase
LAGRPKKGQKIVAIPAIFCPTQRMSFDAELAATITTFQALTMIRPQIDRAGGMILRALKSGNKLLLCGNGGSGAEAQHFSTELVGRYFKTRKSLPAVALTADGTLLTCIGNDFGYDNVFARQIEGLARPGDLVVVFTSSGNSENILRALRTAQLLKLESIAFLGRDGGRTKGVATCELIVPGTSGRTAQESHLFLLHHFCELIDQEFASQEFAARIP